MGIEIQNITFSYKSLPRCRKEMVREKKVLNDFSAAFESGKITALTGPNGVGKSTLAGIIMGIKKADEGSVLVDGRDIGNCSLAERGRMIGYAMQNPAKQIFNETVLEEVMYGLKNCGFSDEKAKEIAEGYVEMFGLSKHMNDFPFNLSHGEKQRLVLASILAMKPNYLILDEPTSGLDIRNKEVLGETLVAVAHPNEEKNCKGCGVIVISHDRNFIDRYCDGEVVLYEQT